MSEGHLVKLETSLSQSSIVELKADSERSQGLRVLEKSAAGGPVVTIDDNRGNLLGVGRHKTSKALTFSLRDRYNGSVVNSVQNNFCL